MAKMKTSPTEAELKKALSILENKIERRERQLMKPFIPLIHKADKSGQLEQLLDACRLVVCWTKKPARPTKVPVVSSTEETVYKETVVGPQPTSNSTRTIERYLGYLL